MPVRRWLRDLVEERRWSDRNRNRRNEVSDMAPTRWLPTRLFLRGDHFVLLPGTGAHDDPTDTGKCQTPSSTRAKRTRNVKPLFIGEPMKKSSKAFYVLSNWWLPFAFVSILSRDLDQRELWCNRKYIPRWYWPGAVVIIPTLLWLAAGDQWKSRRGIRNSKQSERHAKGHIVDLYKAGRHEEADRAYWLYYGFKNGWQ